MDGVGELHVKFNKPEGEKSTWWTHLSEECREEENKEISNIESYLALECKSCRQAEGEGKKADKSRTEIWAT